MCYRIRKHGINAGAMLIKNPVENRINAMLAAQISPVGLEFGGIGFRGFIEGGLGTQGVIVAGPKYRF